MKLYQILDHTQDYESNTSDDTCIHSFCDTFVMGGKPWCGTTTKNNSNGQHMPLLYFEIYQEFKGSSSFMSGLSQCKILATRYPHDLKPQYLLSQQK